jgi:hypothetical protein
MRFPAAVVLLITAFSMTNLGRAAPARTQLSFLPGPVNPEDLVAIPHSRWLIASNFLMDRGKENPGDLYLIDRRQRTWTTLLSNADLSGPARAEYSACPGPPAHNSFGSHGLALREGSNGHHQLYVVNHVARESVEILEVASERDTVGLRWVGCVLMPGGTLANAVAPLPDGGFVVTSMFDRSDPDRWKKVAEGADTGVVYRWEPKEGLTRVAGTEASGNNGIVVDATGTLFVAAWSGRTVFRMKLSNGAIVRQGVPLDFLPDNLRWAPDGSILIAGQKRDLSKFFEPCHPAPCRIPWVAARLNPKTLQVSVITESDGTDFSDATTALEVGNEIWLGSAESPGVAIYTFRPEFQGGSQTVKGHFTRVQIPQLDSR